MYSMPLIGEKVRLYFPNESNEEPIVIGCVRTNGDTCGGTSETKNRYLQTEHGSEIAMLPGALNIKGGSKAPLSVNFEDETGVTLTSPSGLNLSAGGEIVISDIENKKMYKYNDKEPEKSEEVAGGEGSYVDEDGYNVLPENSLAPASTIHQPIWWRYVSRDSEGWPTRKRQGKVKVK